MNTRKKIHTRNLQKKLAFLSLLLTFGCTSLTKGSASNPLPLKKIEEIKLDRTFKTDIEKAVGKPDQIVSLIKTKGQEKNVAWLYLNAPKDSTRASFIFDEQDNLLQINWFTESTDPESSLDFLFKRYAPNQFTSVSVPWTEGDAAPNDKIYRNTSLGIDIWYKIGNRFVESIAFSKPHSAIK